MDDGHEAKAQFRKNWDAWKAWAKLEDGPAKAAKLCMLTRANSTFDGPLAPLRRGFLYALLGRVTALSRAWCLRQSPYPLDSSLSKPIRVALALRRNCDDRLGKHFSTRTQGVPPKRTAVPG